MNRLDVLIEARDKIAKGWTQYRLHERWYDGGYVVRDAYCPIGAVEAAAGHNAFLAMRTLSLVSAEINPDARCVRPAIYTWNDWRGRSVTEVLAVFDRAILHERSRLPRLAKKWDAHHTRRRLALDTPDPAVDLLGLDLLQTDGTPVAEPSRDRVRTLLDDHDPALTT